jgi:protein-S-isoprenylcysteine O-methyltransferase Ste14
MKRMERVGWTAIARLGGLLLVVCALVFVAAGSVNWPMGWVYVVVSIASTAFSRFVVLRRHPDLAAERGGYQQLEGVKSWDKAIMPWVAIYGPVIQIVVCGLNRRFGWKPTVPLLWQVAGIVVLVLSSLLGTWAMASNPFFGALMRIQKDRGHRVISAGPYRFVRHPGYVGGIVANAAGPLALGSVWALIPGTLTSILVVIRTALEDRALQEELDGYKEYTQRVRYKLLPGVW